MYNTVFNVISEQSLNWTREGTVNEIFMKLWKKSMNFLNSPHTWNNLRG